MPCGQSLELPSKCVHIHCTTLSRGMLLSHRPQKLLFTFKPEYFSNSSRKPFFRN